MRFPLTPDLARAIDVRIQDLGNARPIVDAYQHKIAVEHRALPLYLGRQGYCAIALTGEILEFDWRNFDEPTPMLPRGRAYAGIVVGSLKFPELSALLPTRQPPDTTCDACAGSGHHPLADNDTRVICDCGGLGFVPGRWPTGELAPAPYTGNVFPDIEPTSIRSEIIHDICSEHHVQTDDATRRLLEDMYDHPERKFYYFRAKRGAKRTRLDDVIDAGAVLEDAYESFWYARDAARCDYERVEPHAFDVSAVEVLFAFERELVDSLETLAAGEMYYRTQIRLSELGRRQIEAIKRDDEARVKADEALPFEVKPSFAGFTVDALRVFPWLRRKWIACKQRRSERKRLS